jgi:hypothetical protein
MARWGMLGPPQYGGQNIRNVSRPHWRGWLGKDRRCIRSASVWILVSSRFRIPLEHTRDCRLTTLSG